MTNSVHISHSKGGRRQRSRRGPFGEPLRATGTAADKCAIRYSSEYWDAETELYYYGHRYYSPRLGRWLSKDPIEEQGGINLYGFVGNNVVNEYDEYGLQCEGYVAGKCSFNLLPLPPTVPNEINKYKIPKIIRDVLNAKLMHHDSVVLLKSAMEVVVRENVIRMALILK